MAVGARAACASPHPLMPASVVTYLWVDRYQKAESGEVASFILISTLLTLVTLPLALYIWA